MMNNPLTSSTAHKRIAVALADKYERIVDSAPPRAKEHAHRMSRLRQSAGERREYIQELRDIITNGLWPKPTKEQQLKAVEALSSLVDAANYPMIGGSL